MKNRMFGYKMDRMPNFAFRMMVAIFRIRDMVGSADTLLEEFDIREGQTVVDYGCGPGSYIARASKLVGDNGHQSRDEARQKILASGKWDIVDENKRHMKCRPKGFGI
jgi:ubiquinone/menaquinone biosynthesis C-methylase UbiE